MSEIRFPLVKIGNEWWVRLSHYSDSWKFRAVKIPKIYPAQEPSGHEFREVTGKGSVKCTSKKYSLTDFSIDRKSQ